MNRRMFAVRFAALLLGAAMLLSHAAPAQASILYGGTGAGQLVTINTTTGVGTLVGSTGFGAIEALEFLNDGTLVGIAGANQLIKINTTTGAGTLIGVVAGYNWVEGLAYDSTNNLLYAAATTSIFAESNRLITINPTTAVPTSASPNLFGAAFWDVDGLAISSAGALYGSHINSPGPTLFSVNTTSGVGTLVGSLSGAVVGMDFAPDGTLYGVTIANIQTGGQSRLTTIDPTNGALVDIGNIGFDTIQALAFGPEQNAAVPEATSLLVWSLISGIGIVASRRRNRITLR